jgi:glycosyltransferase involved in cell wall biosynthesis
MIGKSVVFLRSNPIAPDSRVEREARSLAKNCFKVIVVGWDREDQFPDYEKKEFVEIYRIKLHAKFGTGLRNLRHLAKWQIALFFWLSKNRNKYDCIHSCDFDTVIPAVFCKLFYKKKVIYDIFDFYADMLRNVPMCLRGIIRKLDLFIISKTDVVIIADESRKEQIRGSNPKELVVIYNSPEDIKVDSVFERNSYNFIIGYVGLLKNERGILEMINVVKRNKVWKLVLGGFGGDEDLIIESCRDAENIDFLGRVPYSKALEVNAASDVLFATYDPSIPNYRYSSANKLFESMMLGKPIIVAKNTGMDLIVQKYGFGFVVDYGNEVQLESKLKDISAWDDKKKTDFALSSQLTFEREFSWKIMEEKLINLYSKLCEGK